MSSSSSCSSGVNLSNLPPDIIRAHILPKLDGPSLLAVGSSSSDLRSLCSDNNGIWKEICQSSWPSLIDPRLDQVISAFPSGYRSFYHDSFPILQPNQHPAPENSRLNEEEALITGASELISVIEIRYKDELVYSRVEVTQTNTAAFLSPVLWIELAESKPNPHLGFSCLNFSEGEEEHLADLENNFTLSWIIIDPDRKRAGNFSSVRPIFARRHWMTNESHLRFATILPSGSNPSALVQCKIEVMCAGKEGGDLYVREVIMMFHDTEFRCLTGKECLVTMQRAMEGGRKKLGKRGEEKVKYEEFLKVRREARERMEMMEKRRAKENMIFRLAIFVCLLLMTLELFVRVIIRYREIAQ